MITEKGRTTITWDKPAERGLGIWQENKLWVSRNLSTYRIEETGGDEARFSVDCRLWPIDVTQKVRETRQFSLPLGSSFARTKSMLHSDGDAPLIVGIGISKRASDNGSGFVTRDTEHGCLTFRESAAPGVGSTGIAILVDPVTVEGFARDAEDYLILVRVTRG